MANDPRPKYCSKNTIMEGLEIGPETIRWWKPIVLEDGGGGGCRTVVLSISPREPTNTSIWTHNANRGFQELETIHLWKTIVLWKREQCPEDEQTSVVSIFERTQQCVPMQDFLPTRFEEAKKITMSKIDQNYGKIEDVSEILSGQFVYVKYSYLSTPKIVFQTKTFWKRGRRC